jgi:acyl-CoA thioester hydrolase
MTAEARAGLADNVSAVRMRMYHSDLVGIFHGRVFEIFEEARTEAFRRLGFEFREIEDAGLAMVVTAVSARFYRQPRMDELTHVGVFVDALTKVRTLIAYEGRRAHDGALLFTGETSFAFVDRERGRPVRVPDGIRRAVERCPGMLRALESERPSGS